MATPKTKNRGRTKAPGGLTDVLFVRVAPDLTRKLEMLAEQERRKSPGRSISRADIARELLYRAIERKQSEEE